LSDDKNYTYYYFNNGFLLGVLIYKTVLCALVWIVSDLSAQIIFKVKLDKERKKRFRKVNDAVDIKFGITFTLIVLVLVLIVLLIVDTTPLNTFIGLCFTIWISTTVPLGCIMYYVYKDLIEDKEPTSTKTSNSSTTGSSNVQNQKESTTNQPAYQPILQNTGWKLQDLIGCGTPSFLCPL